MTASVPTSAIAAAVVRLRGAGCVFAEEEAAVLSGAARDEAALDELVRRRALGEPLEQVVGYADFAGVRVRLRPGVFVPRVRSGLLVRVAVEAATGGGPVVVDLCCGSGALGLAVRRRVRTAELHAADLDAVAVACARDNLGPGRVYHGDLFQALPERLRGRIDVLIANVPYVATRHLPLLPPEARLHEPRTALDGGDDGLDVFRAVAADAPAWLAPGGVLISEIATAQEAAATAALRTAGLDPTIVRDEDLAAQAVVGRRDGRA